MSLQIPPAPPSASSGGGSTLPIGHVLPPPLLSLPMQSPQGGFPNQVGKFPSGRYQFPSCAQALSLRIPPAPPSASSGWGSTLPIGHVLPQPLLALPMQSPQGGFPKIILPKAHQVGICSHHVPIVFAGIVATNPPCPTQRQQWRGQHAPYRSRAAPATAGAPHAVPPGGLPKNNVTGFASSRCLFGSCAQALSLQIPPAPPSASSGDRKSVV